MSKQEHSESCKLWQGLVSQIRLWDCLECCATTVSCVQTGGTYSSWFKIEAGVCQGCVLAPDSFATGMDWLLDRTVESCLNGVAFGQNFFTDLDFADDVSLLAEILELLVPILETMASEPASLWLEVNWQKTTVQALGCREDMPLTIKVQGQDVTVVKEFVYIGSLIHSTTESTCDISRRSAMTCAAMQSLQNQIWRSRLAISTKLYNTCILPIFLYGSDFWAISKMDACKIDALDQWCLRMLLGIKWYQFVRNDDVRRLTKQPKLTAIIQSRRLTLFGHIMCMDNNTDAKRILLPPLRQTGEDNQVVPTSRGSAPSNRIWNNTTLRSPKQPIWLRTALCGGWCRRMVLRNACQKRWRQQT